MIEPVRLPGRDEEMLLLVVVSGCARQPTVGTHASLVSLRILGKIL